MRQRRLYIALDLPADAAEVAGALVRLVGHHQGWRVVPDPFDEIEAALRDLDGYFNPLGPVVPRATVERVAARLRHMLDE